LGLLPTLPVRTPRRLSHLAVVGLVLTRLAGGPLFAAGDTSRSLLYVDNTAGDEITMIDTATNRVAGNIISGPAPHGLVTSPDGRRLYISSEGRDELLAVDTATATILWRHPLSARPNEISISPDGRHVYVPIRGANFLEVVDTQTHQTVARIKVGLKPHNSYRSPDGRSIYVTSMGDNRIAIVDIATQRVVGTIPLPGEPRPLAITPDDRLAYVQLTGLHGFVVADLATRQVVDKVELPPADVAAVSAYGYTPSHGIGIRPGHPQLWANNVFGNSVEVFSLPDHRLLGSVPVGGEPDWMDFSADGSRLYISNPETNNVSVIDCDRMAEIARVPVGLAPKRVLFARIPACQADSAGWRGAAARLPSTDYHLKDTAIIGCDLSSLRQRMADGSLPIASAPAFCRQLGILGIEADFSLLPARHPAELLALSDAFHREGRLLTAVDLETDFTSDQADGNQERVETAKNAIRCARYLGAPLICLRLTGREAGDSSPWVERTALAIRQLLEPAREQGVRIAIETDLRAAAAADSILRVIRATDPLWVGTCVDYNVGMSDAALRAEIEKLGPAALLAHVECRRYDRWGNESSIDYHNLLPMLGRLAYGSTLSIRYVGDGDQVRGVTDLRDLLVKEWLGRGILPRDPAVAAGLLSP
jgi:YVTN family beta-propeller protein